MQKYKISEYIGKKVKIISSRHSLYYLECFGSEKTRLRS